MSRLAQHLARIDVLRVRAFPHQRTEEADVVSGPGYHLAELARSEGFWGDDGTARAGLGEEYEAECGALSTLLSARWGEPQLLGMGGALIRGTEGEEIPEPWRELSGTTPYVELWRAEERWIAVAVTQRGPELPLQLLAAVTVNDPP
ncbi:hypothetical protein K378_05336 [Streptomyces sp. Amel2xB2]|uniref:hypothetical protein n=1 Tax=Streptomyces sp. Amel2xB2 TaxID=1305829 RepID=UPI000DB9D819|nr:hypothetical protein [Streptomyces sp. Amel2xB2]RAJ57449.1 hypothetical protein K378_05336 [Streptomyces sp. Amel2xB2]